MENHSKPGESKYGAARPPVSPHICNEIDVKHLDAARASLVDRLRGICEKLATINHDAQISTFVANLREGISALETKKRPSQTARSAILVATHFLETQNTDS